MDTIQCCLGKIKEAENVITDSLAKIAHATKVISDNQALITTLIAKEVQRKSLPAQTQPHEDDEGRHYSDIVCSHPDIRTTSDDFCCPDCGKRNVNAKARRRHYATHIPCAQISTKDRKCVCCQKPMKLASHFEKNHKACVIRMAGQLTEATRVEAYQQKNRITNAITTLLHTNMRQAKDRDDDGALSGRRIDDAEISTFDTAIQSDGRNDTGISENLGAYSVAPVTLPFLPGELGIETGSNRNTSFLAPESYQALHETTSIQGMMANINEEIFRGSAMVLNPIDGVLEWDIPNM